MVLNLSLNKLRLSIKKESRRFPNAEVKLQVFTVLVNIWGEWTDTEDKGLGQPYHLSSN